MDIKARDVGFAAAPGAYVHLFPNVAGFVGADHVAMILGAGIHRTDKTVLGVDIGTNTEMVLAHRGELHSCSCASGPALEGAHIVHGMRAAQGAVERVWHTNKGWRFATIGGLPPVGICGSGIVDAVGELCRIGLLNKKGRLLPGTGIRLGDGGLELVLSTAGSGREITLTEGDIREVQLAKAAIRAGMELLLRRAGLDWGEVEEIVVAGAFGSHLRPEQARAMKLFPPDEHISYRNVGNAAGVGARMGLVSKGCRRAAAEVATRINHVELMNEPLFGAAYGRAMYF